VYSSGETFLTLNEPTPQQAHTVFSRMKLAPREAYDDQKMAFLKDAADFETMHQAVYLPVLSKALENGDLDALPSLERMERLEANEVIVAAVASALDRDDWQTARACYQRVKQSLPFPNWYDEAARDYDKDHRERVARTWRAEFGPVLTRLARRLDAEAMIQMQARAKRPKDADASDPEFLDWFRRGMFPKDHPQSLLKDIDYIYRCVGRSEDFADCMSAYAKSIELTKTLPLETNQYFRPRGSASGFGHTVFRMMQRGAKAPTDPTHPGEAATFAIALRTQPTFRPEGWQAQVMKWLRHDLPYLAEVILDNLPEPIPDEVLEYLPTALAQDYVDLRIAACHVAEKHPRPIYQEPLKAILETATDKYLRKFAVDATRANGLEAQYDEGAPFVEQVPVQPNKAEKAAPAPQDRAEARPATPLTTLTGRFVYDGTPPEPRNLKIPIRRQYLTPEGQREGKVVEAWQRAAEAGVPDETLLVDKDGGIANVVIWLRNQIGAPPPDGPLPPATVRAQDYRLQPHVLAFWNAAPLRLENAGTVALNLKWYPLVGEGAANPLLKPGEHVDVRVARGQWAPVPVSSGIQPWYQAYVLPLNHPYFAFTSRDGRFEIKNLPLGEWEFRIWHERTGWLKTDKVPTGRFTLAIKPGENSLGDMRVAASTLLNSEHAQRAAAPAALTPEIDRLDDRGFSQLHRAAMGGHVERVRALLAQGANVDVRQREFHGTPLQYAAHNGNGEIVQVLLEHKATVDSQDKQGRTPFIWAAMGGRSDMIRRLLDAGANIDAENEGGWTALHYASQGKHPDAAQLLVDRGADPYALNSLGQTPLDLAPATMNLRVPQRTPEGTNGPRKLAHVVVHLLDPAGKPVSSGGMTYAHVGVPPLLDADRIRTDYHARYSMADAQGTLKTDIPTGLQHMAFRLGWGEPRFLDWNIPERGLTKTVHLRAPSWRKDPAQSPRLDVRCKLVEAEGRYFIEATLRSDSHQPHTLGPYDIQIWSPTWNGGWYVYPGRLPQYTGIVVPPRDAGHLTLRLPWSDYLERGHWHTYGPLPINFQSPAEDPGPGRAYFQINVADGATGLVLPVQVAAGVNPGATPHD
jgi:hypothetical protein